MVPMEDFVTLTDENGNDVEFEFLDYVKYKNEEYVVLLPTEDCNGEVLIMKLTGGDVNDEEYEVVGDQKVADAVFETFKEKFRDEYVFEELLRKDEWLKNHSSFLYFYADSISYVNPASVIAFIVSFIP